MQATVGNPAAKEIQPDLALDGRRLIALRSNLHKGQAIWVELYAQVFGRVRICISHIQHGHMTDDFCLASLLTRRDIQSRTARALDGGLAATHVCCRVLPACECIPAHRHTEARHALRLYIVFCSKILIQTYMLAVLTAFVTVVVRRSAALVSGPRSALTDVCSAGMDANPVCSSGYYRRSPSCGCTGNCQLHCTPAICYSRSCLDFISNFFVCKYVMLHAADHLSRSCALLRCQTSLWPVGCRTVH